MREAGGHPAAAWLLQREAWVVCLAGAAIFAAIPLWLGYMGISWDALNHHIYLGWTAEQPRFDRDFVAAAYQSYQFPYLYWPFYKLAMAGVSGATAGAVLALLHATAIPAVWMIARSCIPGEDLFAAGMRLLAVLLAFLTGAVLSLFDATSNDLMAAIPLLWAYAFALRPLAVADASALRCALVSGAFAGMAVAFKLSNGFLVVVLPLLWTWPAGTVSARLVRCVAAGLPAGGPGAVLWLLGLATLVPLRQPDLSHVRRGVRARARAAGVAAMTRFQPDTLLQALLRFFDMVAPDANIYLEIPAPDLRFAAIAVLALVAALLWRKLPPQRNAVFALLATLLLSTALWLATTGNGRYFMAMLVCAGPLAIALICLLPVTRGFKALLALLLVAGQLFVVAQQPPWGSWSMLQWRTGPYFAVDLGPEQVRAPATTYASLSLLTYSLIAPQFPPESRWINLYTSGEDQRTDAFLRRAVMQGPVRLLAPSMAWASEKDGRPTPEMVKALDKLAARRNLRIAGSCDFINSPGLVQMAESLGKDEATRLGFWTCPVAYQAGLAQEVQPAAAPREVLQVFAKLGELCPRFFPPGETSLRRLHDGWFRAYPHSQTKLYVLDNGEVWYHFWRALNPVMVGKAADLVAGEVQIDCLGVRNDGAWRTGAK
ncbi:hypothetical protein [Ramlibacter montanisoli]|uniref:Glycosyltransferase RgtA/B/C/D-like domain-containing protein n=1 Tax=Ramlibacter montanisoli TaxID=2732512 RepID=A0A849KJ68_9BURK|nr:hypothetical protein [Ramlibacter montanisoli]NNU44875.1 hypothetical protein [Ramlibacter montanisoli]